MAKTKISEYSSTANSNTDIASINIDEGCAPSGINNAIRALMAQLKDFQTGAASDPVTVGGVLTVTGGSASAPAITTSGDTNTGVLFPAADTVGITTGGTERVRVDSSGNVGIGVTPSSWSLSGLSALQIKSGSVYGYSNEFGIQQNAYYNSGWKYINSSVGASQYTQNNATHVWQYAASGTAGAAITWSEAMRIDSSGNVGIGTSSPSYRMSVKQSGNTGNASLGVASTDSATDTVIGIGYHATSDTNRLLSSYLSTGAFKPLSFWTSDAERMRIDTSGNLLVGTTSTVTGARFNVKQSAAAHVSEFRNGSDAGYGIVFYNTSNTSVGSITWTGSTTTYATASDYRLKENVQPLTGALETVAQLKPCTYTWKADGSEGQGFIAHELQAVVPDCVTGEKDAVETYVDENGNEQMRPVYQGIDTSFLVATLTAAIQELKAIVDAQAVEIAALKGQA